VKVAIAEGSKHYWRSVDGGVSWSAEELSDTSNQNKPDASLRWAALSANGTSIVGFESG
jgi:hypothetical protein